jgi:hypothetical protein
LNKIAEAQKISQELPADFPNKNSGSLFQSLQICNRVALVGKTFRGLITAHDGQRGSGTCVLEERFQGQKCVSKA